MSNKGKGKVFWDMMSEDRDLVFFVIGFLIWVGIELGDLNTDSWLWILSRIAIPLFFISGIVLYVRKHYRIANQLTSIKHLPVVFITGKPQDEIQSALNSAQEAIGALTGFRAFHQIENTFNVRLEHLVPYERRRLPPDIKLWQDFIQDAERNIRRFSDVIPGEKVYHIFIDGPASLALGAGVAFGIRHRVVVYQFSDGTYQPVLDFRQDIRRIKEIITETEYQHIKVTFPTKLTQDIAIVLDMASHSPTGEARAYLNKRIPDAQIVEVSNTYGGNLKEKDWAGVVQELYSVFNRILSQSEVSRLHLFHAMPVAMAFGLGMALGNFVPVTVYNLERLDEIYYPVIKLNELESFL